MAVASSVSLFEGYLVDPLSVRTGDGMLRMNAGFQDSSRSRSRVNRQVSAQAAVAIEFYA